MVSPAALLVSGVSALGGLVGFAIAYVAWRRRDHPAAQPFAKQSAFASTWALVFAGLLFVRDPGLAAGLVAVSSACGFLTAVYFFEFTVVYTGRNDWLTTRRRTALLAVFGGTALLTLVDPVTGILRRDVTIRTVDGLTLAVAERTAAAAALDLVVGYPVVLVGIGLLGSFLLSERNLYRRQTAVILGAVLFTAAGNVFARSGLTPHPRLDLTPIFYAVEAAVIAVVLFYYDFLDVEPIAPEIALREMDDPVFVLDDAGTVRRTNPAAEALLGERRPTGEDIEAVLPGLRAAAEAGDAFEYVPAGADEAAVYDCSGAPIRDQFDRERGSVIVLRDVTLQKRRERTLEALQTVNQRFLAATRPAEVLRITVGAAEDVLGYPYSGALLYDADADAMWMAAATDPLFDSFAGAEMGTPTRETRRVDGDETAPMPIIPRDDSDVWTVFESGESMLGDPLSPGGDRTLPVSLGGTLLFPLGEHGVLGISSGPDHEGFSDDDRRFARTLASASENALDRVRKEAELRESRALLKRRNEQIEFFNSVLRHDLLNGMNVVQAHTELAREHVDEAGRDHVETIAEYSDDIVTLTRKVRSVTTAVTDGTDPDLEPVDLSAAIERKVEKVERSHEGVTVRTDVEEDLRVAGDDLLPAVIENLLGNAVEHNDGDAPDVTVRTVRAGDEIRVRIADDGPGIPDEMREAVFEREVTSDDSGSVGFGLYFVDVMMDRYGGSVRFEDGTESTAGSFAEPDGAVAVLTFPAEKTPVEH